MSHESIAVDILINGRSYTINCPADEEQSLVRSAEYINHYILDIRKHAPQIPHEQLLVLCALNLYEKAEMLEQLEQENVQAEQTVGQMLAYAKLLP